MSSLLSVVLGQGLLSLVEVLMVHLTDVFILGIGDVGLFKLSFC